MTDRRGATTTAVTVLFVACLFVVAVSAPVMAIGVGSSGVESAGGGGAVEPINGSHHEAIAPALHSASGPTEIVVRFEGDAKAGSNGAEEADASDGVSTDDLKADAATAQADFERFAEENPAVAIDRRFWLANAMLVTVDTDRVPIDRLLDVRGVEHVHGNFEVELDAETAAESGETTGISGPGSVVGPTSTVSTTSTGTNATEGVEMVRAPEVWETFGTRGEGATVAVIDTGINPDHPDLTVSGWAEINETGDVIEDDSGPYDLNGHGTHIAGTVAGGNSSGTAIGVAPDTQVHAIKVFPDDSRETSFARVVGGMEAALNESVVGERADVLQMSFGADGYFDEMIEPVQNANDAGAIVIASSGNSGEGSSSTPGNVYDVLAVGAVDANRDVAGFSSGETVETDGAWGNDAPEDWPGEYIVPDVSAPGVNVYSADPGGAYKEQSGTSMAAPHASGVAALMIAASEKDLSEDELYDTLRNTADHPSDEEPDSRYGSGIIDGFAAVTSITEDQSNFTVTDFDAPNDTVPGATVEASATISNTGEGAGIDTVEYRFNDSIGDTANVSLDAGEETTVSFECVVPNETESDEYEHGVYTKDTNQTAAITVFSGPFYELSNFTAPTIAEHDGPLNTTVSVRNQGSVTGDNRTVELRLGDPANASNVAKLAAENVSLGVGNSTTLSLNSTVPSGFGAGETTVTVATSDDAESRSIRIADAVGTINGTVTDVETNVTLSNVDVVVENGTTVVGSTTSDANGTYAVDVPATDLTVTASNATYAPANRTVTLNESGDTATANFSLALRNGTLVGVVDASDTLDLPSNVTVTVANETGEEVTAVDTASDGAYSVALRPGNYNATADAPDFDDQTIVDIGISPNATTNANFTITPQPASLSGTVTNASHGEAIPNATVTVDGERTTTADTNGTYAIDTLSRGEREITVSADGYAQESQTLTLTANETRVLNVSLSPRGVFSITELSGDDEIEQGSSGSFDLTVRNDGRVADDVSVDITLNRSGSASPNPVVMDDVAVGDTESKSFSVSLGSSAAAGTYVLTATTPDSEETVTFVGVGSDNDGNDDGGNDDDDSNGGDGSSGGGGGSSGGSGGGGSSDDNGGGDQTTPPADDTDDTDDAGDAEDDEPTNETDETDETDETAEDEEHLDGKAEDTAEDSDSPTDPNGDDDSGNDGPRTDGEAIGEANDSEADDATEDDAPGFGIAVGVVALLVTVALARRRR